MRVLEDAGSQSVVSVSAYSSRLRGSKAFYKVAAAVVELCEAAQLTCIYLGYALVHLGMCLGLGMP